MPHVLVSSGHSIPQTTTAMTATVNACATVIKRGHLERQVSHHAGDDRGKTRRSEQWHARDVDRQFHSGQRVKSHIRICDSRTRGSRPEIAPHPVARGCSFPRVWPLFFMRHIQRGLALLCLALLCLCPRDVVGRSGRIQKRSWRVLYHTSCSLEFLSRVCACSRVRAREATGGGRLCLPRAVL